MTDRRGCRLLRRPAAAPSVGGAGASSAEEGREGRREGTEGGREEGGKEGGKEGHLTTTSASRMFWHCCARPRAQQCQKIA